MKRFLPKRLSVSRFLLLIYFLLLTGLGIPLGLLAIKLNVDYRRKAETVTVKVSIPPNPFNTPNYKELYNKPPEIMTPEEMSLTPEVNLNMQFTITDPDWIPGLELVATRFSSNKPLPAGLKILCKTQSKTKSCSLVGIPLEALREPQVLTIKATDALDAMQSKKIILR
jgi:hypothetical protein